MFCDYIYDVYTFLTNSSLALLVTIVTDHLTSGMLIAIDGNIDI